MAWQELAVKRRVNQQHPHMIKRGAKTDGRARQGGAPRDLLRREGAGADRHGCGAELRQLQRAGERAAVWRMPAGRHGEKRAASGEWRAASGGGERRSAMFW